LLNDEILLRQLGPGTFEIARHRTKLPVEYERMTDEYGDALLSYLHRLDAKFDALAETPQACGDGRARIEVVVTGMRTRRASAADGRHP
jgi:hypothetical protein